MKILSTNSMGLACCALALLAAAACGEPESPAPKPRIPSKWVGTYTIDAEEYYNGVYHPFFDTTLTFVIGDIPHLFIDLGSIHGGPPGKGSVDLVIWNTEEKLYILSPHSEPSRDDSGWYIRDQYSHVDTRYILYAYPPTAEEVVVTYSSSVSTPNYWTNGDNMISWRGRYIRFTTENHDCRTYKIPCEE